jgi:hypothetical protein
MEPYFVEQNQLFPVLIVYGKRWELKNQLGPK